MHAKREDKDVPALSWVYYDLFTVQYPPGGIPRAKYTLKGILYSPGNPAVMSLKRGLRPVAMHPTFSGSLFFWVINVFE